MSSLKIFEEKKVRSVWDEGEGKWYFCIIDVIYQVLNLTYLQILRFSPRCCDG